MTVKTPEQLTQEIVDELDLGGDLTEGAPKTAYDLTQALQSGWIDGETVFNLITSAIQADRTQRSRPLVVLSGGELNEGEHVDVLDLGFMDYSHQSEYEQDDIDTMVDQLRDGGFADTADRLTRWWAERPTAEDDVEDLDD